MRIVLLFGLTIFGLSVTTAYPDDDGWNEHNTEFIRAHFEIVSSIRHLKADLGVLPSSDAKTALLADFNLFRSTPTSSGGRFPARRSTRKFSQTKKPSTRRLNQNP